MKKTTKSILAKSLAVALAFSVAGIAPNTEADAASKKPTVTKKVSVKVGAKKTVKVTSKKKVKKTTWSLTKAGKKVVSLSKKKAKSVVVKGKKKGTATLKAKVKVGSKTYPLKTKITVTKKDSANKTTAPDETNAPVPSSSSATATQAPPEESKAPATSEVTLYGGSEPVKYTIDETQTYKVDITALNETTYTSVDKHPSLADSPNYDDGFIDDKNGVTSFTSNRDYNSGISFYVNPCKSESDLVEENGNLAFQNGAKDVSEYDFIRVSLSSENEMNLRTYATVQTDAGFPGASTSETYEGGWLHEVDGIWNDTSSYSAGNQVKDDYVQRNVYIRISDLISKGMNPTNLAAVAISPQGTGVEVEISAIDFVKVKYDVPVTAIEITSDKEGIANGKRAVCTAKVTPENATRTILKWSSSDESLATVNARGQVVAAESGSGKVTITAAATDGSGVTATKEITIGEDITTPTETDAPVAEEPDAGAVYENCTTATGLANTQWKTVTADLAAPITINPGDKVEVSLSAKCNGDVVKDVDAAVMFAETTAENDAWNHRVGVQTGQNPDNADEWRWVKTDGKKVELFNTLEKATTVVAVAVQTANVSPALGAEDLLDITIDKIVVTPKPYENCATLTGLANTQWKTVTADLAEPITVNPGDKVKVVLSAKCNGDVVKDVDAAVMFATATGEDTWAKRVGLQTGQNPDNDAEWRWVKTDGTTPVELFNTLTDATTVVAVAVQTANVSPALGAEDLLDITIDKIYVIPAAK